MIKQTKYKVLPAIKPSVALNAEYQKQLLKLLRQMRNSISYYCLSAYQPIIDEINKAKADNAIKDAKATPSATMAKLKKVINAIRTRYQKKFNHLAGRWPKYLVEKIQKEVTNRLKNQLIKEMEIDFKYTPQMKLALKAAVQENVVLIKSIPQEYLKRVEFDINDSIVKGRSMTELAEKLERKDYGISRRRAITIAYDQTNKITETVDTQRKLELGLFKARWRHSSIPQEPRISHVHADGKEFDIRKGCYIDGEYIQPKEKPNCYHRDTEVYTKRGFIRFADLLSTDKVLSLNPKTKNLQWVNILHFVKKYVENIINIDGRDLHMSIDKSHVFYGSWAIDNGKKIIQKEGFIKGFNNLNNRFRFYKSCEWVGKREEKIKIGSSEIPIKDYCLLMGYYLSEGSLDIRKGHYRISIAQKKFKEKMFKDLVFFKPHLNKQEIAFYNKDISKYLSQFGFSYQKFIPEEIKNLDKKYIRIFLDAYCLGDGTIKHESEFLGRKGNCYNRYYTSSKKMAHDLAECIIKTGMSVSIKEGKQKGKEIKFKNGTYKLNHNIFFVNEKKNKYSQLCSCKKNLENYNDFVYDIELERNHVMLVKFKDSIFWGSNCNCYKETILKFDNR